MTTTTLRGSRLVPILALLIVVIIAAVAPQTVPLFRLTQLTTAVAIAIALAGLNMVSGYLGQLSLAQSAFFGLGAYTSAILSTRLHWSVLVTLPIAAVLCAVIGMIVELPAMRLDGLYLALVTLAVAVAFPSVIQRFGSLTGGSSGLFNLTWQPPRWTGLVGYVGAQKYHYWVAVAVLAVVTVGIAGMRRSRVGRAWLAIKDNEISAVAMGVPVVAIKTITCGISAAVIGVGGGGFAYISGVLTPNQFGLSLAIMMTVSIIIGGNGNLAGPVIGGLGYVFLPYYTSNLGHGPVSGVLFAGLLIILIFLMPEGIAGRFARSWRHITRTGQPGPPVTSVAPEPPGSVRASRDTAPTTPTSEQTSPARTTSTITESELI